MQRTVSMRDVMGTMMKSVGEGIAEVFQNVGVGVQEVEGLAGNGNGGPQRLIEAPKDAIPVPVEEIPDQGEFVGTLHITPKRAIQTTIRVVRTAIDGRGYRAKVNNRWTAVSRNKDQTFRVRAKQKIDPQTFAWAPEQIAIFSVLNAEKPTHMDQAAKLARLGRRQNMLHHLRAMITSGLVRTVKNPKGQMLTAEGRRFVESPRFRELQSKHQQDHDGGAPAPEAEFPTEAASPAAAPKKKAAPPSGGAARKG